MRTRTLQVTQILTPLIVTPITNQAATPSLCPVLATKKLARVRRSSRKNPVGMSRKAKLKPIAKALVAIRIVAIAPIIRPL